MLNPDYYRRRAEDLRRKAAAMIDLNLRDQMKGLAKEYDDLAMSAENHRDKSGIRLGPSLAIPPQPIAGSVTGSGAGLIADPVPRAQ
jgi:hypothetical protein